VTAAGMARIKHLLARCHRAGWLAGCGWSWRVADLRGGADQGGWVGEGSHGSVVIRTPDQRLRVFVSSTMGELAEERRAVSRAVSALRLTPVLFELGAHPPREVYRAYLAQSDVFVGLYWQRYGWIGPGMAVSAWRRSSICRQGCRGCCTSRRRRPTASRGWPICWPGSGRRRKPPTMPSARPLNWAEWCVRIWRRC
jgi:uncharacterized protein DUF4062